MGLHWFNIYHRRMQDLGGQDFLQLNIQNSISLFNFVENALRVIIMPHIER